MASYQYIYVMKGLSKTYPGGKKVVDNIYLSFLPGVKIVPYYKRTDLIDVTTETVRENLVVGMVLVVAILLMFLGSVRSALIIAINLPLSLLFAFSVLYLRGRSANLLSIGAVDFGIIVDSSVIVVENIYRKLSSGEDAHLPLGRRIVRAAPHRVIIPSGRWRPMAALVQCPPCASTPDPAPFAAASRDARPSAWPPASSRRPSSPSAGWSACRSSTRATS